MIRDSHQSTFDTLRARTRSQRNDQWMHLLAKFGLAMSIERPNYMPKQGSGFRPLYAFVSPMKNVPPEIVERCVVKPNERTRYGMGFTDRTRNAYVFRVPDSMENFIHALEGLLKPQPAEQLEIQ